MLLASDDTGTRPARIASAQVVSKGGVPVAYDAEGVAARPAGGYWLGVEGSGHSADRRPAESVTDGGGCSWAAAAA